MPQSIFFDLSATSYTIMQHSRWTNQLFQEYCFEQILQLWSISSISLASCWRLQGSYRERARPFTPVYGKRARDLGCLLRRTFPLQGCEAPQGSCAICILGGLQDKTEPWRGSHEKWLTVHWAGSWTTQLYCPSLCQKMLRWKHHFLADVNIVPTFSFPFVIQTTKALLIFTPVQSKPDSITNNTETNCIISNRMAYFCFPRSND